MVRCHHSPRQFLGRAHYRVFVGFVSSSVSCSCHSSKTLANIFICIGGTYSQEDVISGSSIYPPANDVRLLSRRCSTSKMHYLACAVCLTAPVATPRTHHSAVRLFRASAHRTALLFFTGAASMRTSDTFCTLKPPFHCHTSLRTWLGETSNGRPLQTGL